MSSQPRRSSHPPSAAEFRAFLRLDHLDIEQLGELTRTQPDLTHRITTRIQNEVASYRPTSSGRRRALIATTVGQAVDRFCAALEDRRQPSADVDYVFQQLGYSEALRGHGLEPMQAAQHIGAQEFWSHIHQRAARAEASSTLLAPLTHALFLYTQHLTRQVVLGYRADPTFLCTINKSMARQNLLECVLSGGPRETINRLAARARWNMDHTIAAVSVDLDPDSRPKKLASQLPTVTTNCLIHDELHTLTVVSKATDSHLLEELASLPGRIRVARSWPIQFWQVRHAVYWTKRALRLASDGVIEAADFIDCQEHYSALCLHADPLLIQQTSEKLLEPLSHETPHRQAILAQTLLVWLETHGSATKIGEQLGVHEQTVRTRMRQLGELFGDQLTDPDKAFSLRIAFGVQSRTPVREPRFERVRKSSES